MPLSRLSLPFSRTMLRRPAVLASVTTLALAALLGGGLLVAGATDRGPFSEVDATAGADASATPQSGGDETTTISGDGTTTSGGDDNVAVANNTRDGSTVYAIRLKVVILNADPDVVDSGNAAVAAASCSDCQTVAIALEGVIVTGDAEVIAPENVALAINSECSNCQTLAYAYQNLQTVDGKVRMTGEGRRKVGELRRQLNALRTSGFDIVQVKEEVDRIAGEFAEVLNTQIVSIGRPDDKGEPTVVPSPSTSQDTSGTQSSPEAGRTQPATQAPSPTPASSGSEPSATAEPSTTTEPSPAG